MKKIVLTLIAVALIAGCGFHSDSPAPVVPDVASAPSAPSAPALTVHMDASPTPFVLGGAYQFPLYGTAPNANPITFSSDMDHAFSEPAPVNSLSVGNLDVAPNINGVYSVQVLIKTMPTTGYLKAYQHGIAPFSNMSTTVVFHGN